MALDYKRLIWLIFPPSPDEQRLAALPEHSLLPFFAPQRYDGTVALLPYQNPYVRAAIHLNKFHHHRPATDLLAACLVAALQNRSLDNTCFVPMPLAPQRQRERGYNQVTTVLTRASKLDPRIMIDEHIIHRQRNTAPQTSLGRTARQSNVKDAFAPTQARHSTTASKFILVDDVMTTGATLSAARCTLATCVPGEIECIVLAH